MLSLSPIILYTPIILLVYSWLRTSTRRGKHPPGPPGYPLVGNVTDIHPKEFWLSVAEWAKQYGDVCCLHVLGQGFVFLSSVEVITELLDKRGAIYSDKPQPTMSGELCGCKDMLPFLDPGDDFKAQRKLMRQAFGPKNVQTYFPYLEQEARALLKELVNTPNDYLCHIRRYAGGLALSVSYGYSVKSNQDRFLAMGEECVNLLANELGISKGVWTVDLFPWLKYYPSWLPGGSFQTKAKVWRKKLDQFASEPYDFAKARVLDGTAMPSLCSEILSGSLQLDAKEDHILKNAANSTVAASADTTMSTISHFILAMMLHPEVLKKAQAEVESVVGSDRLPTMADRPHLPYVESIMSEVWRWGVPMPLILAHTLREDDHYQGMYLKKKSIVFANVWSILRDESLYPSPTVFDPDRFGPDVDPQLRKQRDPRNFIFGFGRRRCPGVDLVEQSVWQLIAVMIAALDITKAHDESGNVIEPIPMYNNALFRIPENLPCNIQPRSPKARALFFME